MLWSITTCSTFPVLFSCGHGGVISPPKKRGLSELRHDDDNNNIFNPVLHLQRYDDGDAPQVQSTQPVELFSPAKEVYVSVSSPVPKKVLKPV